MHYLTLLALLRDVQYHIRTSITFKDNPEYSKDELLKGLKTLDGVIHKLAHNETNQQNIVKPIVNWFEQAKPEPTERDLQTQIGCHFEEVAEMYNALKKKEHLEALESIATAFKQGKDTISSLNTKNARIELLDALCDQIVTAIGVAYMMGFNIEGALKEVNDSNWSKFKDGKPIFNEQGKIMKGENYFKPNLEEFV